MRFSKRPIFSIPILAFQLEDREYIINQTTGWVNLDDMEYAFNDEKDAEAFRIYLNSKYPKFRHTLIENIWPFEKTKPSEDNSTNFNMFNY